MNHASRDLLEQHFDTAFAAPDGIAKLRELILTLAMQGKLVEQNPADQPASELLKDIDTEKQRLVKAGKIKAPKPLPPIKPEEMPYPLPQGWEWVRLIGIGFWALGSGLPHSIQGDTEQAILLCKVSDMNLPGNEKFIITSNNTVSEETVKSSKLSISDPGTIIFPKIGGAIATNKRRILRKRTVIDNNCLGITPYSLVDLEWVYQLLSSVDFSKFQTGTSVPAISQGTIGGIVIGLPPLPEQHRIVARIDQLMARCDALETLSKEREEKRLVVHAAVIQQLLSSPSDSAWGFIQQHFGELYSVKANVAELRKAILQLAVMGRLVPQDSNDAPASELLKDIDTEKQRLVKAGKIKAPKPLPPIRPEEVPYPLPQGWEWVRLGEIGYTNIGLTYTPSDVAGTGIPVLRSNNIQNGKLDLSDLKRVKVQVKESVLVHEGDLLICARNGSKALVGKTALITNLTEPMAFGAFMAIFRSRFNQYLLSFINSPLFRKMIDEVNTMTINQITQDNLRSTLCPLPPLPEQHRIVARIEQLMALCDTLEQKINDATDKQTELLGAVMAQV